MNIPSPLSTVLSAVAAFGLASPGTSQAAKYNVAELPTLPGGTYSEGSGINRAGQVAGTGDDASGNVQAILWTNGVATVPFSVPEPDSSSVGVGINNAGVLLGNYYPAGVFAVGPTLYTSFASDLAPSVGALNDSNYIVGTIRSSPVIWVNGDLYFDYEHLPTHVSGDYPIPTILNGINAAGVVVGDEYITDSAGNIYSRALRWTPAPSGDIGSRWSSSTIKLLQGLGGRELSASAINNNGMIAGWARLGNGWQRATLWGPTTSAYDLGTLGGKQSAASGINSMSDVAGEAQTASGAWHAVVWTHKHFVPIDLNLEISATWQRQATLISAVGTNDRCMVLVNGIDNRTSKQTTFVLSLADQSLCNNP